MENTPVKHLPHVGGRTLKTIISATLIAIIYSFFDRSACFACIGAVFGMGDRLKGGLTAGGNRFIGTLIGGLVSLPFYLLYHEYSHILPQWVYLSMGLFLLMMICQMTHAYGGVQPGAVVFFVVIYTVADPTHFSYVFARILDTGIGVAFSLLISWLFPSPVDERERERNALETEGKRLLMIEKDIDAMHDYQAYLREELERLAPLDLESMLEYQSHLKGELEKLTPLIEQLEREQAQSAAAGQAAAEEAPALEPAADTEEAPVS